MASSTDTSVCCGSITAQFVLSGVRTDLKVTRFSVFSCSPTGLKERDLYSVLNTCNDLSTRDGRVTWQEVLQLSRKPIGRVPMATFTRMVQSLQRYKPT